MKKLILLLLVLSTAGCTKKPVIASTPSNQPPIVVNVRDTLAGASGFVANGSKAIRERMYY